MAFFCIQTVKIIVGQLHFRSIQNGKTHTYKDVFDLVQSQIHGVLVAHALLYAGNGYVHSFGFQTCLKIDFLNFFLLAIDFGGQLLSDLIGQLTDDRPFLSRELAHLFEHSGQLTLLT